MKLVQMKSDLSHLWSVRSIRAGIVALLLGLFCVRSASAELVVKYRDLTTGRLAFALGGEGQARIAVLDFDDRSIYYLPPERPRGEQRSPVWSPDGTRLLYTEVSRKERQVYVVNCDGTELTQLTKGSGFNDDADWAPDGNGIVFSSSRRGRHRAIYTMRPDGSQQKELFIGDADFTEPRWSPRGSEIVVGTDSNWPGKDLLLLSLRDQRAMTLTAGSRNYFDARWNPFGSVLAFATGTLVELDVWMIRKGDPKPTRVTSFPGIERNPEWLDDGKQLFYVKDGADGTSTIHLIDVEKKQDRVVLQAGERIRELSWTPFFGIRTPPGSRFEETAPTP